jgi:DNA polymerase III subunit alpha
VVPVPVLWWPMQKITDLDPLEYDLLFERFLNPERVSMPDFDVDFCMEKRDRVIEHVAEMYGRNAVIADHHLRYHGGQSGYSRRGSRAGPPLRLVDRMSKTGAARSGHDAGKSLCCRNPNCRKFTRPMKKPLIDMARKLEGVVRNAGKHAGGVVIAPTKMTDFAPMYCDAEGQHGLVTQFDKNDVEYAGLVKFDFLGLRTLTIIDWALEMINARRAKTGLSRRWISPPSRSKTKKPSTCCSVRRPPRSSSLNRAA